MKKISNKITDLLCSMAERSDTITKDEIVKFVSELKDVLRRCVIIDASAVNNNITYSQETVVVQHIDYPLTVTQFKARLEITATFNLPPAEYKENKEVLDKIIKESLENKVFVTLGEME